MAEQKNDKKPEETPAAAPAQEKKKLPQLGALEDDDEFEDFPASEQTTTVADTLATAPGTEQLWEDNWDDDDVEDDFQKQLRQAIAERAGGGDEAMKE
ncbi:26S proteasome complex subunit SEM1 [Vanrija pseudolonga]|uniref:26S proteasome complex subunit SEM1 n=1 Tax=Vanrija pseudolonga TaxID=143232 RepID=A0AAF0YCB0_9TREE|nr:26S proteasome complex subunit SEM1 [Vanrija pseudolonga]